MNFSHFFIRRPIFAAVLSIVIVLVGGIAVFQLPIAQYPEIAPPTVVVPVPVLCSNVPLSVVAGSVTFAALVTVRFFSGSVPPMACVASPSATAPPVPALRVKL